MKLLGLLFMLLLLSTGCDNPARGRVAPAGTSNAVIMPNPTTSGTTNGFTTTTGGTTSGFTTTPVTTSGTTSGTTRPAGFETCDITPKAQNYAAGIGLIGICQSTLDETAIAVKPTLTDTLNRTCLIPTYKDTSGNSTYLGQPQCFYTQDGVVITGNLFKTRTGYTSSAINGVMVMKERSLSAYFACMDAYVSYVSPGCPYGARTSASCDNYARSYMNQLCNDFRVMWPYIDIRLRL